MNSIKVYVRYDSDEQGTFLGEFTIDALPTLIESLQVHEIREQDVLYPIIKTQYLVGSKTVGFEIVYGEV